VKAGSAREDSGAWVRRHSRRNLRHRLTTTANRQARRTLPYKKRIGEPGGSPICQLGLAGVASL